MAFQSGREPLQAPKRINTQANLSAVEQMRRDSGTTSVELVAEHVEDARTALMKAMRCADETETRDLHVRIGLFVNELDDFRAVLAERHSS